MCHTKCSNLAEVRWPLLHMMYLMYTELLHCICKPVGKVLLYMYMYYMYHMYNIYIYIYTYIHTYRIFPTEGMGGVPPTAKNLVIPAPNFYSLPIKSQFNPIKKRTSFSAVIIAPVLFILFWITDHANFDFNWCSVFTKCCF